MLNILRIHFWSSALFLFDNDLLHSNDHTDDDVVIVVISDSFDFSLALMRFLLDKNSVHASLSDSFVDHLQPTSTTTTMNIVRMDYNSTNSALHIAKSKLLCLVDSFVDLRKPDLISPMSEEESLVAINTSSKSTCEASDSDDSSTRVPVNLTQKSSSTKISNDPLIYKTKIGGKTKTSHWKPKYANLTSTVNPYEQKNSHQPKRRVRLR